LASTPSPCLCWSSWACTCIPAQAIIVPDTMLLSYFGHRHFSFRRSAADARDETSRT
jgi:hypothetical protein